MNKITLENDSWEAVNDFLYDKGWTDGLPVFPPTEDRVEVLLSSVALNTDTVLGEIPPSYREADLKTIAINAVMAGVRPEHFPVVIACVKAVLEHDYNLLGVQATTHNCAPLIMINGPIIEELHMNTGSGSLGPGDRTTAVIGRALRFIMVNVGGGRPPYGDNATFGQPAKFSYAFAENEKMSPWEPFHITAGYHENDSTVTLIAAEGPQNVNDHGSTKAEGVLTTIAGTMNSIGHNNIYLGGPILILLGPEHAEMCAKEGLSKKDIKNILYEKATVEAKQIWFENRLRFAKIRLDPFAKVNDNDFVHVISSPDNILIAVAGGPGRHSTVIPSFGATQAITKTISS